MRNITPMEARHLGLVRCELLLLLTTLLTPTTTDLGRGKDDKVRIPLRLPDNSDDTPASRTQTETVIIGSSPTGGMLVAPPSYPGGNYSLDATSYVFVLENVQSAGSVQLRIDDWDLHPLSWVTFRNSKYGGYIGRVLGRYDVHSPPPGVVSTPTCCLRVEFQTGCCTDPEAAFSGFSATYRFVNARVGGRRTDCDGEQVYSQLCNGECILEIYTCPCPTYGQYKCANGLCLTPDKACDGHDDCGDDSDERLCAYVSGQMEFEAQGSMFGFTVVISTVMSIVSIAFVLIYSIRCAESIRSMHRKRHLRSELAANNNCPTADDVTWATPEPEVVTLSPTPPARVTPMNDFRCETRSVAVLTTGRPPCVKVRPLGEPIREPYPDHVNNDDDDVSASRRCESGFHGDNDRGTASSSSSAAASENDVRSCDLGVGSGSEHNGSPKVKTKGCKRSLGGVTAQLSVKGDVLETLDEMV